MNEKQNRKTKDLSNEHQKFVPQQQQNKNNKKKWKSAETNENKIKKMFNKQKT